MKIQIGSLFRILTKNTRRYQYLICQHTFKIQFVTFYLHQQKPLLFTNSETSSKLPNTYNDGLLFIQEIDPLFHDDFSILCQVLNKHDGLSQPEIQSAFENIKPFTKWEAELIPETSIKPSLKVINSWNNIKRRYFVFF